MIKFYRASGIYGCFSNFYYCSIHLKGKVWPTSEHYFQAQKFAGTAREELIRLARSPGKAAELGRDRDFPLRSDWEDVKDGIMYQVVLAKFSQNDDLYNVLANTGDQVIIEHTANDHYWGDGGDGLGLNRLGQLLMKVRTDLMFYRGLESPCYYPGLIDMDKKLGAN